MNNKIIEFMIQYIKWITKLLYQKKFNIEIKLNEKQVNFIDFIKKRCYNAIVIDRYIGQQRGGDKMKNSLFMTAEDIVAVTGMSEAYAYKLIRKLNEELESKGYITLKGRVSRDYFEERLYGAKEVKENASL